VSLGYPTEWAWLFGDEISPNIWKLVNSSSGWTARYGHTSVSKSDNKIILMGGNDGVLRNDTWMSIDNGTTWSLMNASSGWSARSSASSVVTKDGTIIIMGGNDGARKNDVWNSTDNGLTWKLVNGSAGWSVRQSFTSVVTSDNSVIIMGGQSTAKVADIWMSTDNGSTWSNITGSDTMWSARFGHTSVIDVNNSILVIGGNDGANKNDVWQSTNKGITWSIVNATSYWSARSYHTSVLMADGGIMVLGGYYPPWNFNDTYKSVDDGKSFFMLYPNGSAMNIGAEWSARRLHTTVSTIDGSIVLMGGYDTTARNDTWRLEPFGSTIQNPSHTYISNPCLQTFNVSLFIHNNVKNSTIKSNYITLIGPPGVYWSLDKTSTRIPKIIMANDTSQCMPTTWEYYWGDKSPNSTSSNVTHKFVKRGVYQVSLSIANPAGSNTSETKQVKVIGY
jgi:hypothetical protein